MIRVIIFALLSAIFFSGCISKALTVGYEQGYCEENGCDYRDAGECKSPYEVLEERF